MTRLERMYQRSMTQALIMLVFYVIGVWTFEQGNPVSAYETNLLTNGQIGLDTQQQLFTQGILTQNRHSQVVHNARLLQAGGAAPPPPPTYPLVGLGTSPPPTYPPPPAYPPPQASPPPPTPSVSPSLPQPPPGTPPSPILAPSPANVPNVAAPISPTPSPNNDPASLAPLISNQPVSLSNGAIAGIVIGCVGFAATVVVLALFLFFKAKRRGDLDQPDIKVNAAYAMPSRLQLQQLANGSHSHATSPV